MKSLIDYIKEHREDDVEVEMQEINEGTKSIKFNFDGMDDADDILKKFDEIQSASVNEKEVEVMCDANVDELKKVYDILKKYSDKQHTGSHRSSDEQYAQKLVKFEGKVKELDEMIKTLEAPEEPKNDEKKKDDKECKDGKFDDKKEEE